MRGFRRTLNSNFHRVLRTIGIQAARVLHRVQALDRLFPATVC